VVAGTGDGGALHPGRAVNAKLNQEHGRAWVRTFAIVEAIDETRVQIAPLVQSFQIAEANINAAIKNVTPWRLAARECRQARRALSRARGTALKSVARAAACSYNGSCSEVDILTTGAARYVARWCESCGGVCSGANSTRPIHERPAYAEQEAFKYRRDSRDFVDAIILHTRHPLVSVTNYAAIAGLRTFPLTYSWHGLATAVLFERELRK
jgi:hypothetical protein